MNPAFEILANRVLSALGNGLYQGLLITTLVALVFRMFRGISATTRHAVGMVTLVLIGVLPVLHFLLHPPRSDQGTPPPVVPERTDREQRTAGVVSSGGEVPQRETSMPSDPELVDEAIGTRARRRFVGVAASSADIGDLDSRWIVLEPVAEPATEVSGDIAEEIEPSDPTVGAGVAPGIDLRTTTGLGAAPASSPRGWTHSASQWLRVGPSGWKHWESVSRRWMEPVSWRPTLSPWASLGLVGIWIGIAALGLLRIVFQCLALRRVKRRSAPACERLERVFRELCREAAIRRSVKLGITDALGSPVAAGFLHPAILLPQEIASDCSDAEVVPLLRHELAHLKRRDDGANLLQLALRAVFFFHPGVLWLSRRLAIDREIACDDHVLAATRRPREYALFLTDFAGRSLGRTWAVAPAAWSKQSQLTERIDMILDTHRNASPTVARAKVCTFGAMAAAVAALGLYAGPRVALAASEDAGASGASTASVSADAASGSATVSTSASALATPEPKAKAKAHTIVVGDGQTVLTTVASDGTTTTLEATLPATPPLPLGPPPAGPAPVYVPHATPLPPVPPTPASARSKHAENEDSLEARLDRLEKMVESIAKRSSGVALKDWKPALKYEAYVPNEKQIRDIARLARESGERAGRDAARVAQDIAKLAQVDEERLKALHEKQGEIHRQARVELRRHEVEIERKALEQQRRVLEKQVREMERQLEQLSNKLEKIDEQVEAIHEREEEAREAEEASRELDVHEPGKSRVTVDIDVDTDARLKSEAGQKPKDKALEKPSAKDKEKEKEKF
ncbi:MAG: hypothetical protein JNK85_26585 [Verrucomicrobiales bacterium]|nr:hypothetical protein [Verrucomicrobiales bacterium]